MLIFINGRLKAENFDYKIESGQLPAGYCKVCSKTTQTNEKEEKCPKCSWEFKLASLYRLRRVFTMRRVRKGMVIQVIELHGMMFVSVEQKAFVAHQNIAVGQELMGYPITDKATVTDE